MNTNKSRKKLYVALILLFVVSIVAGAHFVSAYTTGQSTANLEVPSTSKTYHITLTDEPQERWISFNKRIYVPFGDEVYYLYFVSATDDTVEYYFTWADNTYVLDDGETASFDIDGDGTLDITLTVEKIYMQTTTVLVSAYTGDQPSATITTETTPADETNATDADATEATTTEATTTDATNADSADATSTADEQNTASSNATDNQEAKPSFFKRIGLWFKHLFGHKSAE